MQASTSATTNNFLPQYNYKPGRETFAEEGKYYEQKVTALISLQALKNTDNFSLISNPQDCAPFDDIILSTKSQNQQIVYLFQIKHQITPRNLKDANFINDTAEFNLQKMYEKYIKAKINIENIIQAQCKYEIIFFTNRSIQNNSKIFVPVSGINLYTTNDGKVYKFKQEFITKEQNSDKRDFLQSINDVYAEQRDIDYTSTCCIKEYLNSEEDIAETIKCDYFRCVKNWCEIKTEKDSLTKEFTSKLLTYTALKIFAVPLDNYDEAAYKKYKDIVQEECSGLLWKLTKNGNLHISCDHIQYVLGKVLEEFQCLNVNFKEYEVYEDIISNEDLKTARKKNQLKYYVGCLSGKLPFIVQNFELTPTKIYFENFKIIFITSAGNLGEDLLKFDENAMNALKQQVITTESGQNINVAHLIEEMSDKISISDIISLIIDNHNRNFDVFVDRRINQVQLDRSIFSEENRIHMENDVFIINGCTASKFIKYFNINANNVLSLTVDRFEVNMYLDLLINKPEYYLEQNQENDLREIIYSMQDIGDNKYKVKFNKQIKYIVLFYNRSILSIMILI